MTSPVLSTIVGGVMTLSMNRPEKKNAITDEMYGLLADNLLLAADDRTIRAVLIRGEGEMFTAGNDIADFAAAKPSAGPTNVGRFIGALVSAPKPLVAAVQGRAIGIGTTMLLHCDQVILAEDATLVTPFVNLGLVPEAGSSLLLPQRVGHARAFAVLAMGQPVTAGDALAWGVASELVPAAELRSRGEAIASAVARLPLDAVIATKALLRSTSQLSERITDEARIFAERLQSSEAREAFAAFAERRQPDFGKLG